MSVGALDAVIEGRRSVRGFLPDPVAAAEIEAILRLARTAPSGANLQPGRFVVLAGAALRGLADALDAAIDGGEETVEEYSYFPQPMPAHLKERQRRAGFALYDALGVDPRDGAARRAQFRRNYRFFDAPVGIVVTIERAMGKGCFMDLGMAIQTLLLAAHGRGLGACGIGALAKYAHVVHRSLGLGPEELAVCGIAIGHVDPDASANLVRTERLTLEDFAEFRGFDPAAPDEAVAGARPGRAASGR